MHIVNTEHRQLLTSGNVMKLTARSLSSLTPALRPRSNFKWFLPFQTRFNDNDKYGHVNNAVYHEIFDSVINIFMIRHVGLDIRAGKTQRVGFMVGLYDSQALTGNRLKPRFVAGDERMSFFRVGCLSRIVPHRPQNPNDRKDKSTVPTWSFPPCQSGKRVFRKHDTWLLSW